MSGRGGSYSPREEKWSDMESWGENETDSAFEKSFNDWTSTLTREEYDAVQAYTGGLYDDLNYLLRTGEMRKSSWGDTYTEEQLREYAKNIQSAMNKAKLPMNVVAHRWSGPELLGQLVPGIERMNPTQQAKALNDYIGSVVTDKGVTSTSTQHVHYGEIRYDIRMPKGTSAHYVKPLSLVPDEMEIATNIGTSYVLKGASVDGGKLKVDLGIYREGRRGREKQVRNVGTRGNGQTPLF